jgi:hypothetical protein
VKKNSFNTIKDTPKLFHGNYYVGDRGCTFCKLKLCITIVRNNQFWFRVKFECFVTLTLADLASHRGCVFFAHFDYCCPSSRCHIWMRIIHAIAHAQIHIFSLSPPHIRVWHHHSGDAWCAKCDDWLRTDDYNMIVDELGVDRGGARGSRWRQWVAGGDDECIRICSQELLEVGSRSDATDEPWVWTRKHLTFLYLIGNTWDVVGLQK